MIIISSRTSNTRCHLDYRKKALKESFPISYFPQTRECAVSGTTVIFIVSNQLESFTLELAAHSLEKNLVSQ